MCFDRPTTALAGTVVGVGIGGIIGLVTATEKWRDTAESARVSIAPNGHRGISIATKLSF